MQEQRSGRADSTVNVVSFSKSGSVKVRNMTKEAAQAGLDGGDYVERDAGSGRSTTVLDDFTAHKQDVFQQLKSDHATMIEKMSVQMAALLSEQTKQLEQRFDKAESQIKMKLRNADAGAAANRVEEAMSPKRGANANSKGREGNSDSRELTRANTFDKLSQKLGKVGKRASGGTPTNRAKKYEAEKMKRMLEKSDGAVALPPGMVDGESPKRLAWDVYMMVLILYYSVMVPYRASWNLDASSVELEHFFTTCFILDMILIFNTTIKVKGELVADRKIIAQDYVYGGWFWIDLVASFPFDALPMGSSGGSGGTGGGSSGSVNKLGRLPKIFRLLRIFKLLRLMKLSRIVTRLRQSTQVNPNVILLSKTLALLLFTLHWSACGYWAIIRLEAFDDVNGWITDQDFHLNQWHPPEFIKTDDDVGMQFAYSFFWGVSVVTGVGWDIIPTTGPEIAYSSLMIVLGTVIYITILSSVTSIVSNFNSANSRKMIQMQSVLAYLKSHMVSTAITKQIRGFYEFMWQDGADANQAPEYIDALPDSLQVALASEMHSKIFSKLPLFRDLPPDAVFFLANNWSRQVFTPKDVIVKEGTPSTRLYFVLRGTVRVSAKNGFLSVQLAELEEGAFFGETSVLGNNPKAVVTVKAVDYCELLYVKDTVYISMVKKFNLESSIGDELLQKAKSRQAVFRWKKAIAMVRTAIRWRLSGQEYRRKSEMMLLQEGGGGLECEVPETSGPSVDMIGEEGATPEASEPAPSKSEPAPAPGKKKVHPENDQD